jgi:chemotaxis protein CheD
MTTTEIELPLVYLQPGEVHLALSPAILRTVLGSCVGVTFWSARLGAGALCHGVLPRLPQAMTHADGYRYVDFSIRDLAQQFDRLGARRDEIEIKVFGGADVLPVHPSNAARITVGRQNSQTALEVLREESLAVLASDLGGPVGRTIQFHTGNGEVLLRRLSRSTGAEW